MVNTSLRAAGLRPTASMKEENIFPIPIPEPITPITAKPALTGLEILIAFLQAYVFAILTCIYINDALHLH